MRLCIYSTTTIYIYTSISGRLDESQQGGDRATAAAGSALAPVLDMGAAAAMKTTVPFRCVHAPVYILNDHDLYIYMYI